MTVPLLWDEAVGRLRSIELLSFDGATLRLRAPNSYIRWWFESNFLDTLLEEIRELGHDIRVEFEADGPDQRPPAPADAAPPPEPPASGKSPPEPAPEPAPPAIVAVDHEASARRTDHNRRRRR